MNRAAILAAILFFAHHSAEACVGCRTPMVGAEEPQTVLAGVAFSWSVITMLVLVVAVVSGLGWYIAKTCQRVDREHSIR